MSHRPPGAGAARAGTPRPLSFSPARRGRAARMAGPLPRAERPGAMGTGAEVDCVCAERGRGGAVAVVLGRRLAVRAQPRETACPGVGQGLFRMSPGAARLSGEADRAGGGWRLSRGSFSVAEACLRRRGDASVRS